jgi:hypothetical protein
LPGKVDAVADPIAQDLQWIDAASRHRLAESDRPVVRRFIA